MEKNFTVDKFSKILKKIRSIPLVLVLVIFLALSLRLFELNQIPSGITNDELSLTLNAKAVYLTGHDIKQIWSPFWLTTIPSENAGAELPYLIMAPIVGFLPFSLFASRLTNVILSILFILILYKITLKLIGKKSAIFVSLVAALNPWSIYFARTSFEAPLAIFFYIFAFYLFLVLKKWKILLVFIPLFLGFYSYMATKILFIPYVIVLILFSFFVINKKKYLKQYLVLLFFCITLFLYFLFSLQHQGIKSRLGEMKISTEIEQQVNAQRRLSIQTPLNYVFSNKLVIISKNYIDKYMGAFSTNFLFSHGDDYYFFALWDHGYFYYLDIIFLILGVCVLFKKNLKLSIFLLSIVLLAPLPSVVNNRDISYALRSSLMFPFLIIFIGTGMSYIFSLKLNRLIIVLVSSIILLIYGFEVGNFINLYMFRSPIYQPEKYDFSNRLLARYLVLTKNNNQKVIIATGSIDWVFKDYVFYTDLYKKENVKQMTKNFQDKIHKDGLSTFVQCPKNGIINFNNELFIVEAGSRCDKPNRHKYVLINTLDSNAPRYKIYNDSLCSPYQLSKYSSNLVLSDFNVEKLSQERFCKKYIISP